MPDTLLPASASMQPPPRPCLQESPEVISVDGSERHTPAGRNGVHRASSRSSIASSRPSAPPVEVIDVDILDAEAVDVPISITKEVSYQPLPRRSTSRITNTSSQQPSYVSRPSNGAHQPSPAITAQRSSTPAPAHQPAKDPFEHITGTLPSPLSAKEEELQREALVFLCRYIRLFDRDRAALASAYSHLATFSVTTHDPSGSASRPSPRTVAQRLRQGRADVVTALLALPAARKFVPEGSRDVDYDVVCLDNKTEVLLMCYVGETKDQDGKVWACDQRFVLRQKACDLYDRFVRVSCFVCNCSVLCPDPQKVYGHLLWSLTSSRYEKRYRHCHSQ